MSGKWWTMVAPVLNIEREEAKNNELPKRYRLEFDDQCRACSEHYKEYGQEWCRHDWHCNQPCDHECSECSDECDDREEAHDEDKEK
jgi:hypothetical protein